MGNNARVYKKRSTAEKYMLNLTISNSLCYSQFTVFVCVCFCVSFNQQQLRNIILNIWFCIVLVISRGLLFLSYMFVYFCILFQFEIVNFKNSVPTPPLRFRERCFSQPSAKVAKSYGGPRY